MTTPPEELKPPEQLFPTTEALKYYHERGVNIVLMTLIRWCKRYKIGKKVVGTWYVDKDRLQKLLDGETV